MHKGYLGKEIGSLIGSFLSVFHFVRKDIPQLDMMELYKKYDQQCNFSNRSVIKKNLAMLARLHDLDFKDLMQVSGLSEGKIKYLINIHAEEPKDEGETNLDVENFVWIGVLLTVNTPHNFERIFDEDFYDELREYGLMGRPNQAATHN